jgi:hypothetical protein
VAIGAEVWENNYEELENIFSFPQECFLRWIYKTVDFGGTSDIQNSFYPIFSHQWHHGTSILGKYSKLPFQCHFKSPSFLCTPIFESLPGTKLSHILQVCTNNNLASFPPSLPRLLLPQSKHSQNPQSPLYKSHSQLIPQHLNPSLRLQVSWLVQATLIFCQASSLFYALELRLCGWKRGVTVCFVVLEVEVRRRGVNRRRSVVIRIFGSRHGGSFGCDREESDVEERLGFP